VIDPSSPSHQLVGAVLNGRWKLVRLLGEGGMGAVYEADGLRGDGKRAIKILHPEFTHEEQILQRFFLEAEATRGFSHQNIASVFEAARAEDGTPYLVMELLQGVPLSAYIDQGNPIPPQQAAPLVYEVLQALMAAHAHMVVHRDLKPDNLFLIRDARGAFRVKVLDFGIAKVMDVAGGMGSKTRTGTLLGTPGYMSPEQIKNSKGVDPRSDLWSVGVIFYEMLTATQPFPAENEFARLTSVLTADVRPIEQIAPHLAAWGPFFQRALAKDLAQRFQSAEEMAQALSAIVRRTSAALMTPTPPRPEHSVAMPSPVVHPAPPAGASHVGATTVSGVVASSGSVPPAPGALASTNAAPSFADVSRAPPALYPPSASTTYISGQRPAGTPTLTGSPLNVRVVEATSASAGAAWWLVGVIGFVCMGLGFALGLLVAR
jgi:eukaryotic-like serine/threonine-protein kinase